MFASHEARSSPEPEREGSSLNQNLYKIYPSTKRKAKFDLADKKKTLKSLLPTEFAYPLQRGLKIELTDVNEISAYGTDGSEI